MILLVIVISGSFTSERLGELCFGVRGEITRARRANLLHLSEIGDEIFDVDASLFQNAAQSAGLNLQMHWDHAPLRTFRRFAPEDGMTSLLPDEGETQLQGGDRLPAGNKGGA